MNKTLQNKLGMTLAIIAVFALVSTVFSASVHAEATGGDGDSGAVGASSPSLSGFSTGGDGDTGATATTDSNPGSTGGANDNGGVANTASVASFSTGGTADTGAVTVTSSGSGSTNVSGGSTNRTTGGSSSFALPLVAGVSTTSCPLITDYLKLGGTNSPAQVTKLQIFLKNSEKLTVDVTGIFDQKTEDAVKAFQIKYLPSILGPWDATRATGFVYITTVKKINELACASPIVLSASELAAIAEYKARTSGSSASMSSESANTQGTLDVDDTSDSDNTAAAGGASILSRFWNFILNLFR